MSMFKTHWKVYNKNINGYLMDSNGKAVVYLTRREAKKDVDDFNSMRKDNPYSVIKLTKKGYI